MKWLFVLPIIFLAGCSRNNGDTNSRDQSIIENMADSFITEYNSAPAGAGKIFTLKKYQAKIGRYLPDHYLNHIRVHVDSMKVDSMIIVLKFHSSKNVAFTGSLTFPKHRYHKEDSLFHFMESLKPGTDTSLDFVYVGKIELNTPGDSSRPVLLIHALPISFQKHALKTPEN
ncbi:MAG TPA: hypothetical protein VK772_05390 [Puia sp.]|nr:hypothetical protein [Puia sp.]